MWGTAVPRLHFQSPCCLSLGHVVVLYILAQGVSKRKNFCVHPNTSDWVVNSEQPSRVNVDRQLYFYAAVSTVQEMSWAQVVSCCYLFVCFWPPLQSTFEKHRFAIALHIKSHRTWVQRFWSNKDLENNWNFSFLAEINERISVGLVSNRLDQFYDGLSIY